MKIIYDIAKPFDKLLKKQKVKAGEHYRPMYYVVEQPVDEGLLLYHTMTKALLLLTPEEAEVYKTNPADLQELIGLWFLVPLSHDDRLLSRQIRDVAKMLEKKSTAITSYTIMTTTDCNARCFYCYEMGRPRVPMSKETAERTADYIIRHCQGKKVLLHWFGGEPLYNKPVISLICQRLEEGNVNYSSEMTTNGYLFNDIIIAEAKNLWKLKKVQITLDGTERIYNHSKAYIYKNVNAYQRVIGNIHKLQDANIHVSIRLNIDNHNADNLLELVNELHQEFYESKEISIYLHTLIEKEINNYALHDCEKRKEIFNKMLEIDKQLADYGFIKPRRLDHNVKTNKCMADSDKAAVIVPDGHIGKCEHFSEDHFVSHVEHEEWDDKTISSFRETHPEIEACATCFNYPNCVRLRLCEYDRNCYQEERNNKLYKLKISIQNTYNNFINKNEETDKDDEDEIQN